VKEAVTLDDWFSDTVHVPVPAQAPLQPVKVEPAEGVAERATLVPEA